MLASAYIQLDQQASSVVLECGMNRLADI